MYYEAMISDRTGRSYMHDAGRRTCHRTASGGRALSRRATCVGTGRTVRYAKAVKRERSFDLTRIIATLVLTTMITFFCGISFGTILSNAETPGEKANDTFKYYKSVTIEQGDSLWSIAEENMTDEYASIQDYIAEVRSINGLESSQIHAGCHLTVPYYSAEFK